MTVDPIISSATHNHPARLDFCREILKDSSLKLLFPDQDPRHIDDETRLYEMTSFLQFSNGSGRSFQLAGLAEHILRSAYSRLLFDSTEAKPFSSHVDDVLQDVRTMAKGEPAAIPAIVRLSEIELPEGEEIRFEDAVLSPLSDAHRRLPSNQPSASAILTTTAQTRLLEIRKWETFERNLHDDHKKYERQYEEWFRDFRDSVDLIRFAIICASTSDSYLAPKQVSATFLDPFSPMPSSSESAMQFSMRRETVQSHQVEEIENWYKRLKAEPHTLKIAMRRILAATSERIDPVDGFIDAVMAWENMFSGTPETSLRVCGAISKLLEPSDIDRRRTLFAELKRLYRLRSNLVHGADTEPSMREMLVHRDRAIEIALNSMREIYNHQGFPGEKSATRSDSILLWTIEELERRP
ncbi:hypothetical protein [Amycolatopsis thailandensis]